MAIQTITFTASNASWPWSTIAPITTLTAHTIGGGGGGGAATGNPATGGGGKGGSYASVVITKGAETTLAVTIGAAGSAGVGTAGGSGGASAVAQGGTTVVRGAGGGGGGIGSAGSTNGAGATTVNGTPTGTTTFVGGNGGTGNFTSGVQGSGAGGGAASTGGNGGAASVNVAGTGNGTNAGAGAAGVGNTLPGAAAPSAGPVYGGGGSGGKANSNTDQSGGAGRQGVVWLVYDDILPQAVTTTAVTSGVADQYPVANFDESLAGDPRDGWGQSFLGDGRIGAGCSFYLRKLTSGTTGTAEARLYAATGTHGVSALPTGPVLATSASLDISTLDVVVPVLYRFAFSSPVLLAKDVPYIVVVFADQAGLTVGYDSSSPTHAGNGVAYDDDAVTKWFAMTTRDAVFAVDTVGLFPPTVAPAGVTTAFLAATAVLTAPTVVPQAVTVSAATIPAGSVVREPSVAYAILTPGQFLADSYAFSEGTAQFALNATNGGKAAQSMLGDGRLLDVAVFALARQGSLTGGTVAASVYASTGTHGTTALPSGSALASSASVTALSLPIRQPGAVGADGLLVPFVFDTTNRVTLTNGVVYCIAVEYASPGGAGNVVYLYSDSTAPSHAGNMSYTSPPGVWSSSPIADRVFQVWTRTYAQVFAPTVTPAGAGDQAIEGATLAATAAATAPTLAYALTLATRTSTAVLTAPTITPAVLSPTITTSAVLFAPTITPPTTVVTGATITTTAQLFAPSLTTVVTITTATLASTALVRVPTLAYALITAPRATTAQAFAPVVTPAVFSPTITTTAVLFAPAITPPATAITSATIAAGSLVTAPTVALAPPPTAARAAFSYLITTS